MLNRSLLGMIELLKGGQLDGKMQPTTGTMLLLTQNRTYSLPSY